MPRGIRLFICVLAGALASGCSLMAPQYSASIDNVQKLKNAGDFASRVGKFDSAADKANANPISLRGSSLASPYGDSYAAYLAEAIRQELALAGKLKPDAEIEISGMLLKNDIDTSGINIATGDIEARFVVKQGTAVRFDKVKTVHLEWESSFAGAVAIPRAQQQYPTLVQALLGALYDDPDFLRALK
jgi:hypothetical protein